MRWDIIRYLIEFVLSDDMCIFRGELKYKLRSSNLPNKTNRYARMNYVLSHINYEPVSIASAVIFRVAVQEH
jgi:hypothetical protein